MTTCINTIILILFYIIRAKSIQSFTSPDYCKQDFCDCLVVACHLQVAPAPPTRLTNTNAHNNAEKNKGEPDQWFHHDPNNPGDPVPAPRQPTADAKHYSTKIYGHEEPWYKHDENRDYFSPRPTEKLKSQGAEECKQKIGKADTMEWYRHDHGAGDDYQATPPRHRTPQHATDTTGDIAGRVSRICYVFFLLAVM